MSKKRKSEVGTPEAEPRKRMSRKAFDKELEKLQVELCRLQTWVVQEGLRVVVVFEGRDAAGKGGVIRRLTRAMSARDYVLVPFGGAGPMQAARVAEELGVDTVGVYSEPDANALHVGTVDAARTRRT